MIKIYKIIHPAWIDGYVDVHAAGCAWRYADARDADAPVMDAHDQRNDCVVIVIEGAAT